MGRPLPLPERISGYLPEDMRVELEAFVARVARNAMERGYYARREKIPAPYTKGYPLAMRLKRRSGIYDDLVALVKVNEGQKSGVIAELYRAQCAQQGRKPRSLGYVTVALNRLRKDMRLEYRKVRWWMPTDADAGDGATVLNMSTTAPRPSRIGRRVLVDEPEPDVGPVLVDGAGAALGGQAERPPAVLDLTDDEDEPVDDEDADDEPLLEDPGA